MIDILGCFLNRIRFGNEFLGGNGFLLYLGENVSLLSISCIVLEK